MMKREVSWTLESQCLWWRKALASSLQIQDRMWLKRCVNDTVRRVILTRKAFRKYGIWALKKG
jgi:hypothetical protein